MMIKIAIKERSLPNMMNKGLIILLFKIGEKEILGN
jgi:hypothetical protein